MHEDLPEEFGLKLKNKKSKRKSKRPLKYKNKRQKISMMSKT